MFSEIVVTPEQIALYKEQVADNQEALATFDVIEKYRLGYLVAKAIADS